MFDKLSPGKCHLVFSVHVDGLVPQTVDTKVHDGLVQDCRNSIANALELLQSCTKPSMYNFHNSFNNWYPEHLLSHARQGPPTYLTSIKAMVDDNLAMQGTRASAAMVVNPEQYSFTTRGSA